MTTLHLWIAAITAAALLIGAAILHLVPVLDSRSRRISETISRAPALDLVITYFTILPLIVGALLGGWVGLAAAIIGQIVAMLIWQTLHELAHPQARKGPRIVHVINRRVGRLRNTAALYVTAIVVPMFWLIRLAQVTLYPLLVWLVRLPPYRHAEWVNVSRQKFDGLVGHDLIWCLYCDWMTGVWSLGSEMLRNVESFWCPIRFADPRKCANCAIDFPDVNHGWTPADATMAHVTETWERMYPSSPDDQSIPAKRYHHWFGHPARLTVNGNAIEEQHEQRCAELKKETSGSRH